MTAGETIDDVEVDETPSFTLAETDEKSPSQFNRTLEGICKRIQNKERVLLVGNGTYSSSRLAAVRINRPKLYLPAMVSTEFSLEEGNLKFGA